MPIIHYNYRSDSQNQCYKACSCRKHGIQCTSACGGCHGVGCSNFAVDNFDLDTADEDGNTSDVFEDYKVWSYQTLINIISLWIALFKNTFVVSKKRLAFWNYLNLTLIRLDFLKVVFSGAYFKKN